MMQIHTFSIVAYDPHEQAWGVGVASKFLAAASVVSWARGGVGAIATQALAKVSYGSHGLDLLGQGKSASEVLEHVLAADDGRAHRQVGMVDRNGEAVAYTGSACHDWAGHIVGEGFACQGNILAGEMVLHDMADAYRSAGGELADRLWHALHAADTAGGDRRGKQSAGVLVVRPDGGYGGDNDRYLDLRVDDDPDPIGKLANLIEAHHLFFGTPKPEDSLPIDATLALELQQLLHRVGMLTGEITDQWDERAQTAFWGLVGVENLEERWNLDRPDQIDRVALSYLRKRFG